MKKLLLVVACAFIASPAFAKIIKKKSNFEVKETLNRLETMIKSKGFKVFARIDHGQGAKSVNQMLRPTELLIFGNPKVGSQLMASSQSIGLDLPVRVLAYKDAGGSVYLSYHDPASLASAHGITNRQKVVEKMQAALNNFTNHAVGAGKKTM